MPYLSSTAVVSTGCDQAVAGGCSFAASAVSGGIAGDRIVGIGGLVIGGVLLLGVLLSSGATD